jgi:P pilus assembly chaperone PapD
MNMRYFLQWVGYLFISLLVQEVYASAISVYPLEVDLNLQSRYYDIQVHNVGNDTAYVKIAVERINHPGQPNQTLTELKDNPYQIGLIVTPSKVVIPVGQTRIVRVLYVGQPPVSDVVYHVKITPVTGQLVAMYSGAKQLDAGVQLIIAYGVSVYARPLHLNPHITAVRYGTALTLSNTGNTSVLITLCKQCASDGTHCEPLPSLLKRLFPGSVAQIILQKEGPLECQEEVLHGQFLPFDIK